LPKASITINARGLNRDLRDDLETALAPLAADIAILIEDGEPLVAPDLSAAPTASRAARLVARGCALIARGRFHLKHSGFRRTARMGADYLRAHTGIGSVQSRNTNRVRNEDLLAAMVVLQHDLQALRADLVCADHRKNREDHPEADTLR